MNINLTDQHIHQISQSLAKFGRSFAEVKKDDSHTNLGFDYLGGSIWSRWATINRYPLILSFNLTNQDFALFNNNYQKVASFGTIGRTQVAVEQEIGRYLTKNINVTRTDFFKKLHFEIPDYEFKSKLIHKWNDEDVKKWMEIRHLANQTCKLLIGHLNIETDIRIWPHHFDTGIYLEPNDKTGIGFGLAMADSMMDEPYFYYSVYGLNGNHIDYSHVSSLSVGNWITGDDWNGAVLAISKAKTSHIYCFLKELVEWTFTI